MRTRRIYIQIIKLWSWATVCDRKIGNFILTFRLRQECMSVELKCMGRNISSSDAVLSCWCHKVMVNLPLWAIKSFEMTVCIRKLSYSQMTSINRVFNRTRGVARSNVVYTRFEMSDLHQKTPSYASKPYQPPNAGHY